MKRQTHDGEPIYKDEVWEEMQKVGNILLAYGYKEASKIPNFFYKKLHKQSGDYELFFADLRGDKYTPVWKELILKLYPKFDYNIGYSCNEIDMGFQTLLLKRVLSIPVEATPWYFEKDPDGFCFLCNTDLLKGKDFTKSQDSEGFEADVELFYCDTCKTKIYDRKREKKLCTQCRERDWTIKHHILYEPELTIKVCSKCHSDIHHQEFPNPLWQQKRKKVSKEIKEKKRRENQKQNMMKPVFEYICGGCENEEYSIKRSLQCPVCETWMKRMKHNIAKFRCTICHKSWPGVVYLDYCQDCGLEVFDELNETDKKILRMNIYSMKNDELRKNYLRRYKENITKYLYATFPLHHN